MSTTSAEGTVALDLAHWMWSALTCSAAIVVLWYSAPDVSANLRTTELPEQVARTSSWFESWRGLGFWFTYPQFGACFGRMWHRTSPHTA